MLLLDEPMAGINPVLGARLLDHMQRLRTDQGVTILFIEHDMEVVMGHADRVIVMAEGRVIAGGTRIKCAMTGVIDAYWAEGPTGAKGGERGGQRTASCSRPRIWSRDMCPRWTSSTGSRWGSVRGKSSPWWAQTGRASPR